MPILPTGPRNCKFFSPTDGYVAVMRFWVWFRIAKAAHQPLLRITSRYSDAKGGAIWFIDSMAGAEHKETYHDWPRLLLKPLLEGTVMAKRKPRPRKSVCYLYLDHENYGIFCKEKTKELKRNGRPFAGKNIITPACSYYIGESFRAMVGYPSKARDRYKITIERIYQKPKKAKRK